jgi:hypothetical protein
MMKNRAKSILDFSTISLADEEKNEDGKKQRHRHKPMPFNVP